MKTDIFPIAERAPILKPLPLKDLLDAFGEDKEVMSIVNGNIRKFKAVVDKAERLKFEAKYRYNSFTGVFIGMVIDYFCPGGAHSIEAKRLKELRRFRDCMKARGRGDNMTADIERARAMPINELIECKHKGGREWAHCPLGHEDKTASFMVNKDGKTAHCFSCGFHGDSISLIMKRYGLNFVSAVKYLNGYYTTPHAG